MITTTILNRLDDLRVEGHVERGAPDLACVTLRDPNGSGGWVQFMGTPDELRRFTHRLQFRIAEAERAMTARAEMLARVA